VGRSRLRIGARRSGEEAVGGGDAVEARQWRGTCGVGGAP
jgi:hypothetical protein